MRYCFSILSLWFILISFDTTAETPVKEFRGVWIATINNIDWPSSPDLSVDQQKKEFIGLLNLIEQYNLNAVILQVRPAADAFYASETEPWSWFLTGKQGKQPEPYWDPLAWIIEECHQRGLELHAWFNPFRVRNLSVYSLSSTSFAFKNPQYTCPYDQKLFLDPGYPQVRQYLVEIIAEVVKKYDIDAVHLDDYFYPYPVQNKPFPDKKSFALYGKEFYPERVADWRRNNIDQFISGLHDTIKQIKPWVKLGISPFGVWRNIADDPSGSAGAKGMSSYDYLYADIKKWLAEGWIDYVMPQLYWEHGNRYGDFKTLANWWGNNSYGKELYIGQALYKSTDPKANWKNHQEIGDQIKMLRQNNRINGFSFYSISHLKKLSSQQQNLLANNYLQQKAVPYNSRRESSPVDIENAQTNNHFAESQLLIPDTDVLVSSLAFYSKTDSGLPVAQNIALQRNGGGWIISWKCEEAYDPEKVKFAIVTFQSKENGVYIRRVQAKTVNQQYYIARNEKSHYKNKLVTIVAVNEKNEPGAISKLFRIKGKKLTFN